MYISIDMKKSRPTKTCSIAQARNDLPRLIHEVEKGTHVQLTRRGRSVAVVISMEEFERASSETPGFKELYSTWRDTLDLEEDGVEPKFSASLRDRSPGRDVKL